MTEPLDVSLRVRLAYEGGGSAKAAVGDIEAIRANAAKLGTGLGSERLGQDMSKLAGFADLARRAMSALEGEAAKLSGSAGGGARLAADLGAIAAPAGVAKREMADVAAAAVRMGGTGGGAKAAADLRGVTAEAISAGRSIADTTQAAAKLGQAAGGGARLASDISRVGGEAARAGRSVDALGAKLGDAIKAQRAAGGFKSGAELDGFLKAFDAQVKSGKAEIGGLEAAANKMGAASGPKHLAEGLGAVSAGATTAHREVDFIGVGAAWATRDLGGLAKAADSLGHSAGPASLRRTVDGIGKDADEARRKLDRMGTASGHGGRHGGSTPLARGLAMPFGLERKVGLLGSAGGMGGLAAGYGVYEVGKAFVSAEKQAMDLETAMAEVKRSVGEMPAEGLKGLEAAILRTSRTTGVATGELAKMTATAAAAGRPVAELSQFMELGAKTAGAFGMQADDAAEKLTQVGTGFRLDQRGIQAVADDAALLQERTGARGAGTLDFTARVSGTAQMAHMAPAQVAAYGGTMQKIGMSPEQAASTYEDVLGKLLAGEKAGAGFTTGLHRMHAPEGGTESAFALQRIARTDPSAAMVRFLNDVKTLSKERRFSVLSEMVGPETAAFVSRLSDHTGDLTRNLGLLEDKSAQSGALDRTFKLFDETTSKKIDRATAAIGAFATKLGQAFAPAVGAAADATARLFDQLAEGPSGQSFGDTLKMKARMHGAKTDAEAEAWIKQNRPRDYDAIYRPEARTKDDAFVPPRPDAVMRDVRPDPSRPHNADELRQTEAFLKRTLAEAKPENATNIRRQLDEVHRQLGNASPGATARPLDPNAAAGGPVPAPAPEALPARAARPNALPPSAAPPPPDAPPAEALRERPARPDVPPPPPAPAPPAALDDDSLIAMPMRYRGSGASPLLRRASFTADDGSADRAAGGSPSEALQAVIEAGTKAGVVAGLREVLDMRGGTVPAAGGIVSASYDGDGEVTAGRSIGGAAGAAPRRSLRYGGGYGPHGRQDADGSSHHRSVRYGRGYGPPVHDGGGDRAGSHARKHGQVGNDAVPDANFQTKGNRIDGLSEDGTRQYAAVLGKRESGNRYGITNPYGYVGRWQMGADALAENGYVKRGTTNRGLNDPSAWTGKGDVHSVEEFKANKGGVQDREFAEYTNRHYAQLKSTGVIRDGMSQPDVAGWLAAAHLKGVGGARALSRGHDNVDANGTSASSYKRMMAGVGSNAPSPGLAARELPAKPAGRLGTVAFEEDRATRARRPVTPATPAETVSPRFAPAKMTMASARPEDGAPGSSRGGQRQVAAASPPVQNFYGMHDPVQTARHAQLEANREVRRSQARALHGIGSVA